MRDRYLGLVLAMLAWVLAPVSFANAAASGEHEARSATTLASPAVVQRGDARNDRDVATTSGSIDLATLSTHVDGASSVSVDPRCTVASLHTTSSLSSAQPRGPPR